METPKSRKRPLEVSYGGLDLRVGTYKSNGRIDISHRCQFVAPNPGKISSELFTREYVPVLLPGDSPLIIGEHLPEDIMQRTLVEKIPKSFLPALEKTHPEVITADLHLCILGPYLVERLNKLESSRPSTIVGRAKTLSTMLKLWGNRSLKELTPATCADDLLALAPKPSESCCTLLRKIYPLVTQSGTSDTWKKSPMAGRHSSYSHPQRVRKMLLNTPPSPLQLSNMLKLCTDAIHQGIDSEKHLAALIVATEGVSIEEVCALHADSLIELPGYKGFFGLQIFNVVKTQMTAPKEMSKADKVSTERIRGQRHIIEELHEPKRRTLGMNDLLMHCWHIYQEMHPEFSGKQLLLVNPDNHQRILAPEQFQTWLDERFKDFLPDDEILVAGVSIKPTYDVESFLQAGAKYLVKDLAEYSSEETRYQFGSPPQAMDAKHYVGFYAPSELVTMAVMKSLAIQNLPERFLWQNVTGSKSRIFYGKSQKTTRLYLEFDINKLLASGFHQDLLFRMKVHGYSVTITVKKKGET